MKGQKNSNLEFHGFASNPAKSFEDGKKGNRLAVQASLNKSRPAAETDNDNIANKQSKSSQGKGWSNAGGTRKDSGKQGKADTEE
ncbi:hypothetical protein ABID22_001844 [Pontibacter aydingkolensis]|uniref:Uncharacterized protein n=1 Tax=Pontibacter aydingkolensis TaxID=1911536 RepID=A0ABS7CPJ9_9BACT|nr:hypothetical protein [Pontibacter aydingkolensis]MBW7465772.1 hypothetical protein [Pontibacter aydingkolensis]